ncbi:MAG: hypothetical protein C4289_03310, partial [Chloroflexota bacterium]
MSRRNSPGHRRARTSRIHGLLLRRAWTGRTYRSPRKAVCCSTAGCCHRSPAVLACGGYRGRRSDLLGIASYLWRRGLAVLLFDYRGHGDHAGDPVTLGYRELEDARAALAYLRQRLPGSPLGVIGYSMGAAIAIMVAAREPDVRAVVADSPFTSQREIVAWHARRKLGPLTEPVLSLVDRQLYKRYGYRFRDVEPLRDVVHIAPRPLLVIHGSCDTVIPLEHAQRIYAAAGEPKELWTEKDPGSQIRVIACADER